MADTRELRELRRWLNESRWRLLDAFIAVNDAVKEREGNGKRRLLDALTGQDEFRNGTQHEEYRPA